jgi:glycosyltransferase involved in cell wall biosynthesis
VKVLHVQRVKGIGGAERHILSLLPGLLERGVTAHLLVLAGEGAQPLIDELRTSHLPHTVVPAGSHVDPRTIQRIGAAIGGERPDLVHTHLLHADLYGAVSATLRSRRFVSTAHSAHAFYRRAPLRQFVRSAWSRARGVIAISSFTAEYLLSLGLVHARRLHIVPYGIDANQWPVADPASAKSDLGLAETTFVLAMASRLIPGKGHDVAIRALAELRRSGVDVQLVLVGTGSAERDLMDLVSALGLRDAVKFMGFQPDVRPMIAAADAVLFPTDPDLSEGFGLAALEAMAAARPVIATDVGPLPEVLGPAGMIVTPRSPAAIARAIDALRRDRQLKESLGVTARERAVKTFNLDRMVERTIHVYEDALGQDDGGTG